MSVLRQDNQAATSFEVYSNGVRAVHGDPARLSGRERTVFKVTIEELLRESHKTATNKGWWETGRSFPETIALAHSELSEALEAYRDNLSFHEIYYEATDNGPKPEGIAVELADLLIRVADTCAYYGIPIEKALLEKMAYNKTRLYKHGGKKL